MNQVIIRDVESKDLPEIKTIIGKTWNLGRLPESESTLEAALNIIRNGILNKSSFGRVAILNEQVVGFIFGSRKGDDPKYRLLQEDGAMDTLALLMATDKERADVIEYIEKTYSTYEQLIVDKINDYDGCLEFFAVSEEARGLKIGQKLWHELSAYFKSKSTNAIYLYTDTSCNYGFYDYNGFSRKDEQEVTFHFTAQQENKTVFLYDYQFNDE